MRFIGILAVAALFCSGCNSLPDGKPPEGDIVKNYDFKKTFSTRGAQNYLITSLSTFCLRDYPAGIKVKLNFAAPAKSLNRYPQKVFRAVGKLAGLRNASKGDAQFELSSVIRGQNVIEWEMKLIRRKDQKAVWSEHIFIDQSKL